MSADADVMIVVGPGGVMAPLDEKYLAIDLPLMLKMPTVIVTLPGRAAINQTLLTARAVQTAGAKGTAGHHP